MKLLVVGGALIVLIAIFAIIIFSTRRTPKATKTERDELDLAHHTLSAIDKQTRLHWEIDPSCELTRIVADELNSFYDKTRRQQ